MKNTIHVLSLFIVVLIIVTSSAGLFWFDGGNSFILINQCVVNMKICGIGLYKNDSAFLAPIFRGTDFITLIVTVPLLLYFIYLDKKQNTFVSLLRLYSLLFTVFYYAFSLAFGVIFNYLHLVYTILLSVTFFTLVLVLKTLNNYYSQTFSTSFKTTVGLKIFISVSGVALFGAWLPDIIQAHISGQPLSYLENYTTSVTYILDMGFISPLLFLSLFLLKKHPFYGVCLLSMLLYLSMLIGIILPAQTYFQIQSGIDIPLPALISKVLIFILLSLFAFYFNQKLYQHIKHENR